MFSRWFKQRCGNGVEKKDIQLAPIFFFLFIFFLHLLILNSGFKVFPDPTVVPAVAQRGQWVSGRNHDENVEPTAHSAPWLNAIFTILRAADGLNDPTPPL